VLATCARLRRSRATPSRSAKPPTISRLVADLEREGLVEGVADEADRRVQRVHATRAGRALLDAGRARRVWELAGAVADDAERRTLERAAELFERIARPQPAAKRSSAR
jgi:DNA-binding MarR family transcriptional regulator